MTENRNEMTIIQHLTAELDASKGLPAGSLNTLIDGDTPGWHVFTSDFHLPLAVLHESAVRHNSAVMSAFCRNRGLSLAPHGKTTMAPELFRIQLEDGAWAITAATVWQARIMRAAGVRRILLANEVVTEPEIRWLAEALGASEDGDSVIPFEISCYVDSIEGVQLMDRVLTSCSADKPLPVYVEFGVPGGRAGVRTVEQGLEVARAVRETRTLRLQGVAGFEGIINSDLDGRTAHERTRDFLRDLHQLAVKIDQEGGFAEADEVVISAGGSAYFDFVAEEFARIRLSKKTRFVLRSGCYLTHDDGGYDPILSPMGSTPRVDEAHGRLRAALEVWGAVLSRPEPGRAIVGIGKRDISPDSGPPIIRSARRANGERLDATGTVTALNDQHAYIDIPADSPLTVGDLVAFGVPHPCTTFDKWRVIPLVDDEFQVVKLIRTYF